jgi:hypothetical protein
LVLSGKPCTNQLLGNLSEIKGDERGGTIPFGGIDLNTRKVCREFSDGGEFNGRAASRSVHRRREQMREAPREGQRGSFYWLWCFSGEGNTGMVETGRIMAIIRTGDSIVVKG